MLAEELPRGIITGDPFAIFNFITSIREGYDVEIGFPVADPIKNKEINTVTLPGLEVLAFKHTGSIETVSQSYSKLYSTAYSYGIISDEICREVYRDWQHDSPKEIELQFVIHNWHALLAAGISKVINKKACNKLLDQNPLPEIDTDLDQRFQITKTMIEKIEALDDEQVYDIVSRCAHRFPKSQIDKLSDTYQRVFKKTGDGLRAVDAVIQFMADDPGWGEKPLRKGKIIYSSKAPRDPKAFEKATAAEEKRKAYCFCPIIRERLDKGMPVSFCYCGAGWYRQQWEGAIGKPVRIEIIESILKGDDRCQFAIHLPEDL